MFTFADLIVFGMRAELAETATRSQLPSIHALREAVDAGGLMSRRTADLPTTFGLIINRKTAKALAADRADA